MPHAPKFSTTVQYQHTFNLANGTLVPRISAHYESEAELSSGESAYVIAATFIADTDRADIRERMISLKPSHLKK